MKNILLSSIFLSVLLLSTPTAFSHCEIPCGIYDDEMRVKMLEEDITTVEKSMKMIVELSKESDKNYNQLVRWINNKEIHADKIQDVVSQYFMTQRLKPVEEKVGGEYQKYIRQLSLLHQMLVYAMKSKQTTELENVMKLRSLLNDFKATYFEKSDQGE